MISEVLKADRCCVCASPPVHFYLCVITGAFQELHLLVRVNTAIFTSQALHVGSAGEQILSCGNNPTLFLKHTVQALAKTSYKARGTRVKKF